jgi:drug/metabolite transporter (DMT)-like permease
VLFAGDYGLIYWGEQFLDSGITSILFAMLPLVTIALAHSTCRAIASPAASWREP